VFQDFTATVNEKTSKKIHFPITPFINVSKSPYQKNTDMLKREEIDRNE